jgi:hypothetical protein
VRSSAQYIAPKKTTSDLHEQVFYSAIYNRQTRLPDCGAGGAPDNPRSRCVDAARKRKTYRSFGPPAFDGSMLTAYSKSFEWNSVVVSSVASLGATERIKCCRPGALLAVHVGLD